jgi:hypothetical protein
VSRNVTYEKQVVDTVNGGKMPVTEAGIQTIVDFARKVIADPDILGRNIYDETIAEGIEQAETNLIQSRKQDIDRYVVDGWELYLAMCMLHEGASEATIHETISSIRKRYPITSQYPNGEIEKAAAPRIPTSKTQKRKTTAPRTSGNKIASSSANQGAAPIFISYSHKDSQYAKMLAQALERSGLSVWVDERIDYGTQWPRVIQEHLDNCSALIVIMTPNSFRSDWVQNELSRAKRKGKTIFPLLLEGDEPWLSIEATQYVDVRGANLPPQRFFDRVAQALRR